MKQKKLSMKKESIKVLAIVILNQVAKNKV